MDDLPEQYLKALQLFNDREFFEAHDELEEMWSEAMGEQKNFLQGLIQASVSLFHFGNENVGGALKLYASARSKLEKFPPTYMGIDVLKFVIDYEYCFEELLAAGVTCPSGIEIRDERIPVIQFVGQD